MPSALKSDTTKLWLAFTIAVAGIAFVSCGTRIAPEAPAVTAAPGGFPTTNSHLSVVVSIPIAAIAAELENAILKSFHFDVKSDARVYGTPSRGPISVKSEVNAKRLAATTHVGGRVQVEKKIVLFDASVGVDVSGHIDATVSPEVQKNWSISPHLDLATFLDRAVAKTGVGDIDITGHVRGAVHNLANGVKGPAEEKLASALNFRKDIENVWNKINSIQKLSENPPVWLRITPREATFGRIVYKENSIDSGISLELNTQVFVQATAPEVAPVPLPDLNLGGTLSDDFELSVPVEVSYAVVNEQLKTELSKNTIKLPEIDAWIAINGATIQPDGAGVLLTVDFNGKKGALKSVSGRLFITGMPVFDGDKAELRVIDLKYSAATESLLLKSADWLAHQKVLDAMKSAAALNLSGELEKAKAKANAELDKLKSQLPKEIGANVSVNEVSADRLAFAKENVFALIKAKGKMSVQLKK